MKILIIGRHEVLYQTTELLSKDHQIVGIVTAEASAEYRKKENDFKELAQKLGCPFLSNQITNKKILNFIQKTKPDIGVSVNWIRIIGSDLINAIPKGILNFHNGDLPKYKGNAAPNWAILMNEQETCLTIHLMKPDQIDSGDIVVKKKMKLDEDTTISDVIHFWQKNVPMMFWDAVKKIDNKSFRPFNQSGQGFRCYPRLPIDGKVDWYKSAGEIHDLIRSATHPYPGAYSFLKIKNEIKKVYIWKSRIIINSTKDLGVPGHIIFNDAKNGESHIYCGKGVLALREVQYNNAEPFEPGRVWKSIRMRLGIDIEEELFNLYKTLFFERKITTLKRSRMKAVRLASREKEDTTSREAGRGASSKKIK